MRFSCCVLRPNVDDDFDDEVVILVRFFDFSWIWWKACLMSSFENTFELSIGYRVCFMAWAEIHGFRPWFESTCSRTSASCCFSSSRSTISLKWIAIGLWSCLIGITYVSISAVATIFANWCADKIVSRVAFRLVM